MRKPVTNQITVKGQKIENNNPIVGMFDKPFYTNKEMVEMLDCTEKTLRRYRNDGFLGYSRVGDKFYYTAIDILLFLQQTHIEPYQYS
jgi:hypothetical protein